MIYCGAHSEVKVSSSSLKVQSLETLISILVLELAKVYMPAETMLVKPLWTWFHNCKNFYCGIGSKMPIPRDNMIVLNVFRQRWHFPWFDLSSRKLRSTVFCGKIRMDVYQMYSLFFLSPELAYLFQTPL